MHYDNWPIDRKNVKNKKAGIIYQHYYITSVRKKSLFMTYEGAKNIKIPVSMSNQMDLWIKFPFYFTFL